MRFSLRNQDIGTCSVTVVGMGRPDRTIIRSIFAHGDSGAFVGNIIIVILVRLRKQSAGTKDEKKNCSYFHFGYV
jgi:hypothetical protein